MDARSLPEAFKLIMKDRSWTQANLAEVLGRSEAFVSRVMTGKADPGISKAVRLLASVDWEVHITPKAESEDPVKRREFVAAAASIVFVPSAKANPYKDAEYIRQLAARLQHNLFEHGGVSLTSTVLRHAGNAESALESSDRELQAAMSTLMRWSIEVLSDARRFDSAENVGALAVALARTAGDTELQAGAYDSLTELNVDRGRADRAIRHARSGLALPEISDYRRAKLNVRMAQSLALVDGQERSARLAIEQTEGFLEDGPSDGKLSIREAGNVAGEVGIALAALARYADANAALENAVRLTGPASPFLHGCFLGRQTEAALRASQPSLASELMSSLAHVAPLVASARLDRHISASLTMSARWSNVPEMREAREQLLAMVPQGGKSRT